jgi:hypothetical protein
MQLSFAIQNFCDSVGWRRSNVAKIVNGTERCVGFEFRFSATPASMLRLGGAFGEVDELTLRSPAPADASFALEEMARLSRSRKARRFGCAFLLGHILSFSSLVIAISGHGCGGPGLRHFKE